MQGFDAFWKSWPKSTRKGAKAACLKVWTKNYYETQADQIVKHVDWMCTTDDWRKHSGAFIPAPLVYLNQQRWDGAEVPESIATAIVEQQRVKWAEEDKQAAPPPRDFFSEVRKRLHS